jgi:hypothetical protein
LSRRAARFCDLFVYPYLSSRLQAVPAVLAGGRKRAGGGVDMRQ